MWQGFERISKKAPKHFEQKQLYENLCCLVIAGQATILVWEFGCQWLPESQCFIATLFLHILKITCSWRAVSKVTFLAVLQKEL